MKKIMILGAGTMARDIAILCASMRYEVNIWVRSSEKVDEAFEKIKSKLESLVSKGKITENESKEWLERIKSSMNPQLAQKCDLLFECVVENMEVKKNLLEKFDKICPPETIFATNTSSLSITDLATVTTRPEKVIGVHFFNPAPVMKLVELIRGIATDDATFQTMAKFCKSLDKEGVEVHETPGFVVNRLLIPMINDAINLLETGVSTAEGIDTCMKLGANHPMGPLALGDFIGLDVCLAIMETLFQETGDPRYRPSLLLKKMVVGKRLGKKTKQGFYQY